ncbi:MAG TPA: hypothetical protein PLJ34_09510, partial [Hyphomicrobiales bacterium]|nr:hypothetical protein [Hyphomicrobiales bacterium]
ILDRLVRAENLIVALDRARFAVTFVGSTLEAVETALSRMAAVIRLTPAVFGEDAQVIVDVETGVASLCAGETGRELLRRALTQA